LEDGSECGALGVGQGWGLSHEVLNVCGEAVRARPWWRDRWGGAGAVIWCGAGRRGGYGRGVGTSPPHGQGNTGARTR